MLDSFGVDMSEAKQQSEFLQPQPRPQASAAALLMPSATVFVGSLCIMVLELTAGRLMAAFLGYSLYTWTSVIGVVLAGIAAGNYFGGRLADRYTPRAILIIVFALAALACGIIPLLNQVLGNGMLYVEMSWPLRVMLHASALLMLPSLLLGMVSPVVATWALQKGLRTGRTVGDIFAWGAIGSIVGTFLTGFFLIPVLGTAAIMLTLAGVLAALSVSFVLQARQRAPMLLMLTAVISLLAFELYISRSSARTQSGQAENEVLLERESQYSLIRVMTDADDPNMRVLILDQLAHSLIDISDPANLDTPWQYPYIKFYSLLTHMAGDHRQTLRTLSLGGGGFVMPQHIAAAWPGSHIEVAEIDAAVTETAIEYLGLPRDHAMDIVHLDVRNHVDDLLRRRQQGESLGQYDFIYGDAFNDFTVPFQLTTAEFHQKLRGLMAPDGIYLLNVVDVFSSGKFLGSELATLRSVFPHVYVFVPESVLGKFSDQRETFVMVCALQPLDSSAMEFADSSYRRLSEAETGELLSRAGSIILTDNYAPVENLLARVTSAGSGAGSNVGESLGEILDQAAALVQAGRLETALATYRELVAINAPGLDLVHSNIAALLARQQKFDAAVREFRLAIAENQELIPAHMGLARALLVLGRVTEAGNSFKLALEQNPELVANPNYLELGQSILQREQQLRRLQQRQ